MEKLFFFFFGHEKFFRSSFSMLQVGPPLTAVVVVFFASVTHE